MNDLGADLPDDPESPQADKSVASAGPDDGGTVVDEEPTGQQTTGDPSDVAGDAATKRL